MLREIADALRHRWRAHKLALAGVISVLLVVVFVATALARFTGNDESEPDAIGLPEVLGQQVDPTVTPTATSTPSPTCREDEVLTGVGDYSGEGWSEGWRCAPLDDLIEARLNGIDNVTKRPAEVAALAKQLNQALAMIEELRAMIEAVLASW